MPSTHDESAILATDLQKSYGSEVALDSLTLDISHGTVYGFLGPNGAGKTTAKQSMSL
jgi:ABC-2 type transport system ATP-binding protein